MFPHLSTQPVSKHLIFSRAAATMIPQKRLLQTNKKNKITLKFYLKLQLFYFGLLEEQLVFNTAKHLTPLQLRGLRVPTTLQMN